MSEEKSPFGKRWDEFTVMLSPSELEQIEAMKPAFAVFYGAGVEDGLALSGGTLEGFRIVKR